MDLYLMQHGAATAEAENPDRPLTAEGRDDVERVATRARAAGVRADRCLHSGKLRAEQTAAILAEALESTCESRAGMNPGDSVAPLARRLGEQADGTVVIVGHLPFLDRLASLLVAGREDGQVLRFVNAGLVRLVPKSSGTGFAVAWVLVPDLA